MIKVLHSVTYSGLYEFERRIGTDPVFMALAFHWCGKTDRDNAAARNLFRPTILLLVSFTALERKRYKKRSAEGVLTESRRL